MAGHFLDDLRASFAEHAGRTAIVHRETAISYRKLDQAARRCAACLQEHGVARGDRVVLLTPQKLPFLVGHLGALFAGGVPLPLNPRFTRQEMRYFLEDSRPRVVIAGGGQQEMIRELLGTLGRDRQEGTDATGRAHPADDVASGRGGGAAAERPLLLPDTAVLNVAPSAAYHDVWPAPDDPCLILYSSGTTGWPKGVVHTHANAASSLAALASCWRMSPADAVLNVLPVFHIHGLAFATHLTWLAGGRLIVHDSFEPRQTMEALCDATVFMAVPPIYYRLLDEPQFRAAARSWRNVRLFTCGSAPIRPEVLPTQQDILGRPVINRYGMTEAFVITSLPLEGPWPCGSVGLPLNGVELRVVAEGHEKAGMRPASNGEVGTVQIRGPNLFQRYWNNPEATRQAFCGGWFDTGDLGSVDDAGFLTLAGRKHDLIITSGYNVYPQVVERVIGQCPLVRECAVVGLPDRQRGECVAAVVVKSDPALDESSLRAWLSDRLVHYAQPRQIAFVQTLPRNNLGKVQRIELRAIFESSGAGRGGLACGSGDSQLR